DLALGGTTGRKRKCARLRGSCRHRLRYVRLEVLQYKKLTTTAPNFRRAKTLKLLLRSRLCWVQPRHLRQNVSTGDDADRPALPVHDDQPMNVGIDHAAS